MTHLNGITLFLDGRTKNEFEEIYKTHSSTPIPNIIKSFGSQYQIQIAINNDSTYRSCFRIIFLHAHLIHYVQRQISAMKFEYNNFLNRTVSNKFFYSIK